MPRSWPSGVPGGSSVELHNDEVPASEVWAVVTESAWGDRYIDWYITPAESSSVYRAVVEWHEQLQGREEEVTITRWYVELPRQRMESADVTLFVEGALDGLHPQYQPRRLDIKRFNARKEAV